MIDTSLFQKNQAYLASSYPQLSQLISNSHISVELPSGYDEELLVDQKLVFDNFYPELEASYVQQIFNKPRKIRTPRFEFNEGQTPFEILAKEFVDKHTGPFIKYLPIFADYKVDIPHSFSRDFIFLGSLLLIPLSKYLKAADENSFRLIESISLVETDIKNFVILLYFVDIEDIFSLFKSHQIGFHLVLQDSHEAASEALYAYITQKLPTSVHSLCVVSQPRLSPQLTEVASWLFSQSGIGYKLLQTIGTSSDELNQVLQGIWSAASSKTSTSYLTKYSKDLLDDKYHAVVVGGGPSLDLTLPSLKSISGQVYCVAAGSSLGSLLKADIKPDACVFLERGSTVYSSVSGLLDDGYSFEGITLICSETTDPRLKSLFDNVISFHRPTSSLVALFPDEEYASLIQGGPEAANAALDFVTGIGFKNIHLFGCDFCAVDRDKQRAANTIGESPRELAEPTRSNLGNTVFTQPSLSSTRDIFEVSLHFNINVMNRDHKVYRYGEGLPIEFVSNIPVSDLESIVSESRNITNQKICEILETKAKLDRPQTEKLVSDLSLSLSRYLGTVRSAVLQVTRTKSYSHPLFADILQLYDSSGTYESSIDLSSRRMLRQIIFYMIAPLYDAISSDDPKIISNCEEKVIQSIDMMETFYLTALNSLLAYMPESPLYKDWDPDTYCIHLVNEFQRS